MRILVLLWLALIVWSGAAGAQGTPVEKKNHLPAAHLTALDRGDHQDVIVVFKHQTANAEAGQQRRARGLVHDDQAIIERKAQRFDAVKRRALARQLRDGLEERKAYSHLPLSHLRLKHAGALKRLLDDAEVEAVYPDEAQTHSLAETLPFIHQPQAALAGKTGAGTAVAVIDTGADYTQPDLGSCTAPGVPAGCRVVYAQDFAPSDGQLDANGHGTNVASIVARVAPGTSIIALDVFSGQFAYVSDTLAAINWVLANKSVYNIVAVNLSLGSGAYTAPLTQSSYYAPFASLRAAGVVPVVASGNGAYTDRISSPAAVVGAVSVGAVYDGSIGGVSFSVCADPVTAADKVTCFSNSASFLTMLAPGASVSAGGRTYFGTSQATPHVAGAVAVLRSAFPADTVDQTVSKLQSGPLVLDARNGISKPRLDFAAIFNVDSQAPSVPAGLTATLSGPTQVTLTWQASSDNIAVTQYKVYRGLYVEIASVGTSLVYVDSGLAYATPYDYFVSACDAFNNCSALSPVVTITTSNPGVPGVPVGVSAIAGNAQATVSFSAPVSNGGAAITGYRVTAIPGGFSATGAASPITVAGLTNSVAYTFTVQAINSSGLGAASIPSNSVTPLATPTTTAISASRNPVTYGGLVTFTASVSGGLNPTGLVTFLDGTAVLGSALLNGATATFTTAALGVGGHTISASYAGNVGSGPSASTAIGLQVVSGGPAAVVSAGSGFSCALVGGGVQCWGYNGYGQLGIGSLVDTAYPAVAIQASSGATRVSAGASHACAVVAGGIQCWGRNVSGQLGTGSTIAAQAPIPVIASGGGATDVSAGSSHTCAVVTGGIQCWGANGAGQLGNNTTANSLTPVTILAPGSGATAVAAGDAHTCAAVSGGVQCWGNNVYGQLGNATTTNSLVPVNAIVPGSSVLAVAAGYDHSCALANAGMQCWGANEYGQLGNGTTSSNPTSTPVTAFAAGSDVTGITAGTRHSCASVAGGAQCWGNNLFGKIGYDDAYLYRADKVGVIAAGEGVTAITGGSGHSCAVVFGKVQCWGFGGNGALGNNFTVSSILPVKTLLAGGGATGVNLSSSASPAMFGVSVTFTASIVGGNNPGGIVTFKDGATLLGVVPVSGSVATLTINNLGVGSHSMAAHYGGDANNTPSTSGAIVQTITAFVASTTTTVALSVNPATYGSAVTLTASVTGGAPTGTVTFKDGALVLGTAALGGTTAQIAISNLAVGSHAITATYSGDASNFASTSAAVQLAVVLPPVSGIGVATAIGAGWTHTCAVVAEGVQCWGSNTFGKLGNGGMIDAIYSLPVNAITAGSGAAAVAAGEKHTCAAVAGGVQCWGYNALGQLGNGTLTDSPVPVQSIAAGSGVTAISAGGTHTCAVVSGGVQCWGANGYGQLGNGDNLASSIPVTAIAAGSGVTGVSAGSGFSCAVVSGGVQCWGAGNFGMLGNNGTADSNVPVVAIAAGSGATAVAASKLGHTCAVVEGGVRCWGYNGFGSLGDGTGLNRSVPVTAIAAGNGMAGIGAGAYHSCAAGSGGLQCWGGGSAGQLGDGTTNDRSVPATTIAIGFGVTDVAAGHSHTCAIVSGAVQCWGDNSLGTLGIGNTSSPKLTPVSVNLIAPGAGVTTVKVSSSLNPAAFGSALTFTAMLSGGATPTGTVTFKDGAVTVGSGPVANRKATLVISTLAPGNHSIVAVYSGDGINLVSTSDALVQAINGGQFTTATVLGASSNPSTFGSSVIFTATVSGFNPSGSVTFKDGSTTLGVTPLSNGVATFTSAAGSLAVGTHNIIATYSGDASNTASTSGVLAQVVKAGGAGAVAGMIAGGREHTCVLRSGGAQCWGFNGQGQLGNGGYADSNLPTVAISAGGGVTAVAAGSVHSCAVVNGGVKCWGFNGEGGSLGNNAPFTASNTPVTAIAAGSGAAMVVAGGTASGLGHTCAIVNGGVQCWGENGSGQVGNSSTSPSPSPVSVVSAGFGVTALALGGQHSCAVANGGLQCWGENGFGQLGTGGTGNSLVPLSIFAAGSGVTAAAAGYGHTCVVINGGVRCWGAAGWGQLGNNSFTDSAVPVVAIADGSGATSVVAQWGHTCAVVDDDIKCWGANSFGQLGYTDASGRSAVPIAISVLANANGVIGIGAGQHHTCVVVAGGTTQCWGLNNAGQLGNGTFVSSAAPVTVGFAGPLIASPTINLTSSSNPITSGSAVTFTATLTGGASPTGTVAFLDGGVALGTATVASGGAAVLSTSSLSAGSHSITAVYGGDANNAASTSGVLVQNVSAALVTTTTFNVSATSLGYGAALTLTAAVSGGQSPGGTISFRTSGSVLATVPLAGGGASYSTNNLAAGYHSLTARYDGDGNHGQSTSVAVIVNVIATPRTGLGSGTGGGLHRSITGGAVVSAADILADFNGDGKSDILWRNSSTGENYIALMDGAAWMSDSAYFNTVPAPWKIAGYGDFDGDGKADVLWRNSTTGENYVFLMDGANARAGSAFTNTVAAGWSVAGIGDFDGDGKADIYWRNATTGENYIALMDGAAWRNTSGYFSTVTAPWAIAGLGDFDGDGKTDVLWRNTSTGASYVFLMDGANAKTGSGYSTTVTLAWSVAGVGDFDGDGKTDILWRNSASGENYISLMNGIIWRADSAYINTIAPAWSVAATGDYDGDGKLDILWRNATTGDNYITFMNGATLKSSSDFTQSVAPGWKPSPSP